MPAWRSDSRALEALGRHELALDPDHRDAIDLTHRLRSRVSSSSTSTSAASAPEPASRPSPAALSASVVVAGLGPSLSACPFLPIWFRNNSANCSSQSSISASLHSAWPQSFFPVRVLWMWRHSREAADDVDLQLLERLDELRLPERVDVQLPPELLPSHGLRHLGPDGVHPRLLCVYHRLGVLQRVVQGCGPLAVRDGHAVVKHRGGVGYREVAAEDVVGGGAAEAVGTAVGGEDDGGNVGAAKRGDLVELLEDPRTALREGHLAAAVVGDARSPTSGSARSPAMPAQTGSSTPRVVRRRTWRPRCSAGRDTTAPRSTSCSVILYVLLVGALPFQDENLMSIYRKMQPVDLSPSGRAWGQSGGRAGVGRGTDDNHGGERERRQVGRGMAQREGEMRTGGGAPAGACGGACEGAHGRARAAACRGVEGRERVQRGATAGVHRHRPRARAGRATAGWRTPAAARDVGEEEQGESRRRVRARTKMQNVTVSPTRVVHAGSHVRTGSLCGQGPDLSESLNAL